ncbi:MAG: Rossmann fold nucleotide-binding protein [Actinomycetota bacterium]|nr:Rossmann fold nucleotide-binding protein [Actinomycetota bacterium]
MKRTRGRVVNVESLADFDRRLAAGATSMRGWRVRRLDLTERSAALATSRLGGATFLGCSFASGDAERVEASGGLVLPDITDSPVDVYRSRLYTADELYDDPDYQHSLDARAYAWSQRSPGHEEALAQSLHDHAIDGALGEWAGERRLVGVMGGHSVQRGEAAYADAARLGHALGHHHVVATGGGPGAMEAANLGGSLSRRPLAELEEALTALAAVPSYRPSVGAWARVALDVCSRFPERADSLGIPTWHYGHEPPNVFATVIAKYFGNPTREAILLEVCDAGIVFLPGTGGTVQEVFQDACENYYADESSVAPMVLVGEVYWTETLPAWPLLQSLARGRAMEGNVHLADTLEEAAALVGPAIDREVSRPAAGS